MKSMALSLTVKYLTGLFFIVILTIILRLITILCIIVDTLDSNILELRGMWGITWN